MQKEKRRGYYLKDAPWTHRLNQHVIHYCPQYQQQKQILKNKVEEEHIRLELKVLPQLNSGHVL